MPRRPTPRLAKVINTDQLTPNMRRITLGGSELANFPEGNEGGYIKLLIPSTDSLPVNSTSDSKPIMRTYTIRHHRADKNELDIDFVVHGDDGPAVRWCKNTKPGDEISFFGPGNIKDIKSTADWFLFVADMSAMPAAISIIERLPKSAIGKAFFQILSPEDQQSFTAPSGLEIEWLVQAEPDLTNTLLINKVQKLDFPESELGIFIAGEWNLANSLRNHLRNDRKIDKKIPYVSSYWKLGVNEEDHKEMKKSIAEE